MDRAIDAIATAPHRRSQTMIPNTRIYFGPPLARLTATQTGTLKISGKINRTAERYLEIMLHRGLDLSPAERACIAHVCDIGFMSPQEIHELPFEVRETEFESEGLNKEALAARLEAASFEDLVAVVEELGLSLIHISEPTRLGMISYA